METLLSGPMFQAASDARSASIFDKQGGHYNISAIKGPDEGYALLRDMFPDGEADEFNFVLFSTSGVHGSYATLEDREKDLRAGKDEYGDPPIDDVTILVVHPRIVGMLFGSCRVTLENIEYLKRLRASSWAVVQTIGRHES